MRINPTFKKISLNSLIYSMGSQLPRLLGLFTLPIITRFLDDTDFGVRGVVMSYMAVLVGVRELGLSIMFQEAFFKRWKNWKLLWRCYHGLILLWTVIYVMLLAGIIYLTVPEEAQDRTTELILIICVPSALFSSTNNLGRKYLALSEKPWTITMLSATQTVLIVSVNLYAIAYLKMGFMGWFIGDMVGITAFFLLVFYPVYFRLKLYPIFVLRLRWIKRTLREGVKFIPYSYSAFLYTNSDKIILDQFNVGMGSIGHYNLAGNFSRYFKPVGNGYKKAVRPTLFRLFNTKNEKEDIEAQYITIFMQKLFLLVCFLAALWIKEIMGVLVSRPYVDQAYPLAVFLLMSYVQKPLFTLISIKMFVNGASNRLWKITVIPGLINVFLNLILIPFYGVLAAAITTFVAMMFQGFIGFYLSVYKKMKFNDYLWVLWIPVFVLSLLLALLLMDSSLWLKGGITGVVLAYGLYLFHKNQDRFFTLDHR